MDLGGDLGGGSGAAAASPGAHPASAAAAAVEAHSTGGSGTVDMSLFPAAAAATASVVSSEAVNTSQHHQQVGMAENEFPMVFAAFLLTIYFILTIEIW